MKVRFQSESYVAYIASQIEVNTIEELQAAIRKQKNLPDDFDFTKKIKVAPIERIDEALNPVHQIYVLGVGLIGFCNAPLKSIMPKKERPEGPYEVDARRAEHTCCWSSAIVRADERILECRKEDARFIRDAMNAAYALKEHHEATP